MLNTGLFPVSYTHLDVYKRQAQVYEQIVSDLKLAIGNLPVSNANGRAHYYAAKALLGKVYLQMAGEPLEDSEAAALAEVELNEVIQSGRFELVKDYFSLFDASNEYSSEYLFDVEFANNGTTTYGGQVGTCLLYTSRCV